MGATLARFAALALAWALSGWHATGHAPYKLSQLPSGVRLVVESDPTAPLVAIEVWVQAGVACETPETSGVAHLLEHLIFKGTAHHPPGALDRVCEEAGGILTATTERDWARYSVSVLPAHWRDVLKTLLEHLHAPAIPPEELEKERQIILQDEYALHHADPVRPVRYHIFEQAFPEHPYGLPLLGHPERLRTLSREAVLEFHRRHYRPERIVVALVGNLQESEARAVVESVWGQSSEGKAEASLPVALPCPPNRFLEVNGVLARCLPAPPARAADAMLATEILRLVLAEPYLGLLYAGEPPNPFGRCVSEYLPRTESGLVCFYFLPPVESDENWQARVVERWAGARERLRSQQARPLIEQAKQWLILRHRHAMRNPAERARLYALYTMLNLPHLPAEYETRVRQITPEQVEALAEKLFQSEPPRDWNLPSGSEHDTSLQPSLPSLTAPSRVVRQRYANGLRAVALQQAERETALIQILIRTDASDAFPAGTDELTARMLFTTTRSETLQTMGYRIALSGGTLQIFWEPNLTRVVAHARPNALGNVLSTLAEGLARSEFEAEHFQRAVRQALWERRWSDGTQEWRLYQQLSQFYADENALRRVSLETVRRFYRAIYRPERVVVVVLAPQAPESVLAEIARYLGNEWGEPAHSRSRSPLEPPTPRLQIGAIESQGTVYAGSMQTLPCEGVEPYLQALIRHTALSEGKGARLFRAFREERGRGYGVRGQLAFTEKGAILGGFVQFGSLTSDERKAFTEILDVLCTAPLTSEEIRRARALLKGQAYRNLYDGEEFTRRLGTAELFGWGYEVEMRLPEALPNPENP